MLSVLLWILPNLVLANSLTLTDDLPIDLQIPQIFVEFPEDIDKPLPVNVLPNALQQKLMLAKLPADSLSMVVQPLAPSKQPPLIDYFSHIPRVPASTQKLIPTFIALDLLGKDFVWKTKVFQQGFVWNRTLYGNLIIQGSGDPKFLAEDLTQLLIKVKNSGIDKIQGNIILDNRQFHNVQYDVHAFDGKGLQPYNAAPNALLINFGTLTIQLQPIDNQQYSVETVPKLAHFSHPQHISQFHKPCGKNQFLPKLTIHAIHFHPLPKKLSCDRTEFWFTFPNSNALIKQAVIHAWQQIEPNFQGKSVFFDERLPMMTQPWQFQQSWWKTSQIAEHVSPTLTEQITDINQFSNNVMTEQLALSLPLYHQQKAISDYPTTFSFIQQWWRQHLNTPPPVMSRASGLCRDCLIQPKSLMALLQYAHRHPDFKTFQASLAVAGESGTMMSHGKRFPNSPAIGRAWIKTGTLDDVSAMAGYVLGQSGQWYAVVGIINFPKVNQQAFAKEILDEMLIWTAKH